MNTDLEEALIENLFDSSAYLSEELENLLKLELRVLLDLGRRSAAVHIRLPISGINSLHC